MRAAVQQGLEGPEAVVVADRDRPADTPDLVRIAVRAAGVGFPDLLMTRGLYQIKQEPPFVLGWEAAGTVVSAPDGSGFHAGQAVCAIGPGAYAEEMLAAPNLILPLPDGMSMDEGAAYFMNYVTALFSLQRRGRLEAGQSVLVNGAAGGAGSAAVQVARALGARVVATASTEEKADFARAAGAHEAVVVGGGDGDGDGDGDGWAKQVKALTDGGVDVVFDPVGGSRFDESLRALRPEGRLVVVGFAEGRIPTVAVNRLLLRNVDVCGSGWDLLLHEPDGIRETGHRLAALHAAGHINPPLGATFDLDDITAALREVEERRSLGKTIVRL